MLTFLRDCTDFIAIFISLIACLITYCTFKHKSRTSIQPILVFTRRSENVWQIENVGQGPAIDVMVGEMNKDGDWFKITKQYPIPIKNSILLTWVTCGNELAATYSDANKYAYTTHAYGGKLDIKKRNHYKEWVPTHREFSNGEYKAIKKK